MSRILRVVPIVFAAMVMTSAASGQTDRPGSKDYPGIARMPGYYISGYEEAQFDSHAFKVVEGGRQKEQAVEGHRYFFRYHPGTGAPMTTALQVIRNYQNAARAVGGQVLSESGGGDDRETTIRLVKGGTELWLDLGTTALPTHYVLTIVEKQAMQQEVTINAAAMAKGIGEAGRVAVYGIHFDTGRAELKPDSEPALVEISKLLTQNAALKVFIVGHTDMVADVGTNMKLSQARAQSVVNALVARHGIAAARLIAFGNGPYAPVASNKTEDGRAMNRRVELVEISTK
jgi:OmpA-OmpF porin, OOP family